MLKSLKVLLIEDSKIDQMAFKRMVKQQEIIYDYTIASSIAEAKQVLANQHFDIVISDHLLGDGNAFEILNLKLDIPVIITTGSGNEELAVQAMKLGAYDYLAKDPELNYLKMLPITVSNAIQRWQAELQSRLLTQAMLNIRDSVYITNQDDRIIFVNQAFCEIYGYYAYEILGQFSSVLWNTHLNPQIYPHSHFADNQLEQLTESSDPRNPVPLYRDNYQNNHQLIPVVDQNKLISQHELNTPPKLPSFIPHPYQITAHQANSASWEGEYYHQRKNGQVFSVFISCSLVLDRHHTFIVYVANDITSRKQTENKIKQLNAKLASHNVHLESINEKLAQEVKRRAQIEVALQTSEERFRTLVETTRDWIWEVNGEYVYTYVSPQVRDVLGYEPEELLGRTPFDFMAAQQASLISLIWETCAKSGQPFTCLEKAQIRKDGSSVIIESSGTPILDDQSNFHGYRGINRDITQRKQSEQRLRDSQERYALAVIAGQVGVWDWQIAEGKYYTDSLLKEWFGYSDYSLGNHLEEWLSLIHQEDRDRVMTTLQAHLQGETLEYQSEYRMRHIDGSIRWVLDRGTAIWDADNKPYRITGTITDITARKNIEIALQESQELFSNAFENAPIGMALVGLDGKFLNVNKALSEIVGYGANELLSLKFQDITHPVDIKNDAEHLQKLLQGKIKSYQLEKRYIHKQGRTVWVMLSVSFVRKAASDEPLYYICQIQDITVRKYIEQERQKFVALVENSSDFIAMSSIDGEVFYLNEAGRRMIGANLGNGTPPQLFAYYLEATGQLLLDEAIPKVMQGQHWEGEGQLRHLRTGEPIYAQITLFAVRDRDTGEPLCLATVQRDITEKKLAQQALQKANDELEKRVEERTAQLAQANTVLKIEVAKRKQAEKSVRQLNVELEQRVLERTAQLEAANKELEAFSYSVSHDLRSPLRSIDGFSQALLEDYEDELDDLGKDYLRRVRSAAQRMAELIDDLLELSRVTRGELKKETVNLSTIAQEISENFGASQPERQVKFTITPNMIVQGDGRLLRAVLENLLGNAWKYTSQHPTAHIEFGVIDPMSREGHKIREKKSSAKDVPTYLSTALALPTPIYFIRDDGAGFDMAYSNKLFGVFQRLHAHNEFEGTGVGLATVQRIVHRHGGQVWAEAAIEQGATFYFTL